MYSISKPSNTYLLLLPKDTCNLEQVYSLKILKGWSIAGNEKVSPIIILKGINIRPFAPGPITFPGDNLNRKTFSNPTMHRRLQPPSPGVICS